MEEAAEKMNVICNIQAMQKFLLNMSAGYDYLEMLHIDTLRQMQSELVVQYNEKIIKEAK